jgi:hypothetical protein
MTICRATTSNDKALNAFISVKAEIDMMLERLTSLSDDHFETNPDEINWGDVGALRLCPWGDPRARRSADQIAGGVGRVGGPCGQNRRGTWQSFHILACFNRVLRPRIFTH